VSHAELTLVNKRWTFRELFGVLEGKKAAKVSTFFLWAYGVLRLVYSGSFRLAISMLLCLKIENKPKVVVLGSSKSM